MVSRGREGLRGDAGRGDEWRRSGGVSTRPSHLVRRRRRPDEAEAAVTELLLALRVQVEVGEQDDPRPFAQLDPPLRQALGEEVAPEGATGYKGVLGGVKGLPGGVM